MLQSGMSRRLCENWCDDPKNGIILAGYSVQGTLAHKMLDGENITIICCHILFKSFEVPFTLSIYYSINYQVLVK